jgi:hypothetical protein
VYKTRWTGDVILPRAERDFPIDVDRVLPAGKYTASAMMSFGATRRARISTTFTLEGPNRLAAPGAKIIDFAAHGEVGRPAHVTGRVQSTGTTPASLDLTLSLFRITGGLVAAKPLAIRRLHFAALAPGTARSIAVDLTKRLAAGDFHVVGRYTDPTGAPQQLTSDFAASEHRGFVDRLGRFFDRHASLIIALIALIAVAVVVSRLLRRQRRLEAELRSVKRQRDEDPPRR